MTTWTNKDDAFATTFDPRASCMCTLYYVGRRWWFRPPNTHGGAAEARLGVGTGGPDSQYRLNASYTLGWAGEGRGDVAVGPTYYTVPRSGRS